LLQTFSGLIKSFSKQPFSSFARLEHVLQLALLKTFLISRRFRFSLRYYCVNSALELPREQNDEMAASRATARIWLKAHLFGLQLNWGCNLRV